MDQPSRTRTAWQCVGVGPAGCGLELRPGSYCPDHPYAAIVAVEVPVSPLPRRADDQDEEA